LYPPHASAPILVGHSSGIDALRRFIRKAGDSRSPVLLLGESGTGKEIVARAIHDVTRSGEFVPIDCSLLGTLLETELFGHTKGAFTGAVSSKAGLIALAEGGTAFFDEIGEFPAEMQAKLLRVLQEKEIRPVGALETHKANFRVIAATNRDLAREMERGSFRQDLYYRLNVVTLHLPPLRQRKEDIPELVVHFLARCGASHQLSAELLQTMVAYDWPGNVRELENCIQRMVAVNSGPLLTTADLPSALAGPLEALLGATPPIAELEEIALPTSPPRKPPGILRLEELERNAIVDTLRFTAGDRSRTAQLLGIGRTTLYRKIKRYKLA
jgi:DNA-binding NtrC family response regulator